MDADDYAQEQRELEAKMAQLPQYDVVTYTDVGEYGVLNIPAKDKKHAVKVAAEMMSASNRSECFTEGDRNYQNSVMGTVLEKNKNNKVGFWASIFGWKGEQPNEGEPEPENNQCSSSSSDDDYYNRRDS